jgi:hypothetical protein
MNPLKLNETLRREIAAIGERLGSGSNRDAAPTESDIENNGRPPQFAERDRKLTSENRSSEASTRDFAGVCVLLAASVIGPAVLG